MLALRLALALTLPVGLAFVAGCEAAKCSKATDCNQDGGDTCLFPAGSGCSAQGHCEKQNSCQETAARPTVYCTCSNQELALQCVPSNGITDRTNNGACVMPADAGDDGAMDAGAAEAGPDE